MNGSDDGASIRAIDTWQDSINGFQVRQYSSQYSTASTFTTTFSDNPPSPVLHDVEYCWINGNVQVFVDGVQSFTTPNAGLPRPDSLWFGNSATAGPQWNDFTLHYVHVRRVTP